MGCFLRSVSCVGLFLWCVLAMQVAASSFESQQSNTTIFDGVKGEPGELSIDANQTLHVWKNQNTQQRMGNGFAFRKINGDFILTVQLKNQKSTDQSFFGLQLDAGDSALAFKTRLD